MQREFIETKHSLFQEQKKRTSKSIFLPLAINKKCLKIILSNQRLNKTCNEYDQKLSMKNSFELYRYFEDFRPRTMSKAESPKGRIQRTGLLLKVNGPKFLIFQILSLVLSDRYVYENTL